MFDVALSSAGCKVCIATSCDENHPPEHIIDGKSDTFWCSTGLYPQEFILSFASLMNLNSFKLLCSNVRKIRIDRCVQNEPLDFEQVQETELENMDGQMQSQEISLGGKTAQHLRVTILSGYDHFTAVYSAHVDGNAVHG